MDMTAEAIKLAILDNDTDKARSLAKELTAAYPLYEAGKYI